MAETKSRCTYRSALLMASVVLIAYAFHTRIAAQTSIPYIYKNVPIGATGAITGISIHPKNSRIMYMRNDGGGYRWDATNTRWICITDNLPISSGPEAYALDPNDTLIVYQMCATNNYKYFHKSSDRGRTWQSTIPRNTDGDTIHIDGNSDGKGANDRMIVDPNNSDVIYYASRRHGLIRSMNRGDTWLTTNVPLAGVDPDEGLHFICGDKGAGTTTVDGANVTATLYVGIWGNGSDRGGVFKSTDGGTNWSKLPGPTMDWVWQGHIATNGTLYLTWNNGVAKYTRGGSGLIDITPADARGQYACVAVDLTDDNGNTAIVTRYWQGNGNTINRTDDGGLTWENINGSHSNSILFGEPEQFSINSQGIAIDPADGKKVWLGDWVRPWYCSDVTAERPHWSDPIAGYEASTMINVYCPPSGCALFSTNYDIGGFRHEDINGLIPYSFWAGHWMAYWASIRSQPGTEGKLWVNAYDPNNSESSDAGLYYSEDGGTNWVRAKNVKFPRLFALGKAAPNRPNPTLYVWGTIAFHGVDKRGIWRSNDATALGDSLSGATWERIYDPQSDTTAQLILSRAWNIAADRQTYGRIYFTTGGRGLWRGDDQTQNPVRANRDHRMAPVKNTYTARITEKGLRITSPISKTNVRIEIFTLEGRIMYTDLIQSADMTIPLHALRSSALMIVKIGSQKMIISSLNVRKYK